MCQALCTFHLLNLWGRRYDNSYYTISKPALQRWRPKSEKLNITCPKLQSSQRVELRVKPRQSERSLKQSSCPIIAGYYDIYGRPLESHFKDTNNSRGTKPRQQWKTPPLPTQPHWLGETPQCTGATPLSELQPVPPPPWASPPTKPEGWTETP